MNNNDVKLIIDGTEYGGWKSVRIAAGIERIARDFDLEVTRQWPGSDNVARKIRPGMACQVLIGNDKLVTGYIDATPISYEGKSFKVGIKGRSKTADLVDCCPLNMLPAGGWGDVDNGKTGPRALTQHAATQWANTKLERIAEYLAKPYKVKVIAEVNTGATIENFSVEQSGTVFDAIDKMMRMNHMLSTDNGNGDLVFIRAGSGGNCTTPLVAGGNILSASASLDYKNVYTHYTCNGQRSITDDDPEPADVVSSSASAVDTRIFGVQRIRSLVIHHSGQNDEGTCRARVEYEMEHRGAKALETTYTVSGWRQEDGSLWLPNTLVQVQDPIIGFDGRLLIVEVTWLLDDNGMRTELRVGPQSGYLTKAEKKAVKSWADVKVG